VGALDTYFPEADKTSSFTVYGYVIAQTIVQVLKQCGDELTRENVMRQAANLKDFELGLLLPGIKINTSSNDYFPVEQKRQTESPEEARMPGADGARFSMIIVI